MTDRISVFGNVEARFRRCTAPYGRQTLTATFSDAPTRPELEAGPASARVATAATLLERNEELARIESALEDARSGRGTFLVIEGPAGIGKTALLAATRTTAAESGMLVLRSRGTELERDFAFGRRSPALRVDAGQRFRARARRTAPVECRRRRGHPRASGRTCRGRPAGVGQGPVVRDPPRPLLAVREPRRRKPALHRRRRRALGGRALASLSRLSLAAARGARRRARSRDSPVRRGHRSGTARERCDRSVRGAHHAAAADSDGDRCSSSSRRSRANRMRSSSTRACARHAGRRSSCACSLDALREGEHRSDRGGRLPRRANRSTRRSVDRFASGFAVCRSTRGGSPMRSRSSSRATCCRPRNSRASTTSRAADAADVLVTAGILAPGRPLTFIHPIVRSGIYAELSAAERARGHRSAARLLAEQPGADERVAQHLLVSEPAGDEWVVERLVDAARQAGKRGAPESAGRLPAACARRAAGRREQRVAVCCSISEWPRPAPASPAGRSTCSEARKRCAERGGRRRRGARARACAHPRSAFRGCDRRARSRVGVARFRTLRPRAAARGGGGPPGNARPRASRPRSPAEARRCASAPPATLRRLPSCWPSRR